MAIAGDAPAVTARLDDRNILINLRVLNTPLGRWKGRDLFKLFDQFYIGNNHTALKDAYVRELDITVCSIHLKSVGNLRPACFNFNVRSIGKLEQAVRLPFVAADWLFYPLAPLISWSWSGLFFLSVGKFMNGLPQFPKNCFLKIHVCCMQFTLIFVRLFTPHTDRFPLRWST